jgi:serine/threonine protein kinase/tetratricopeptide (TPR) repeat protein
MRSGASGETIGRRYQILDTLGQGGMGTVHRARDRLGGFVALKRLATSTESWNRALLSMEHAVATTPEMRAVGTAGPLVARTSIAAGGRTVTSFAGTRVSPPSEPAQAVEGFASTQWYLSAQTQERSPAAASAVVRSGRPRDVQVAEMLRLTLAREFRLLSSLRHPNIISVLDYGFDDHLEPYFTMELLEGADTIMSAGKALPIEGKLDLLAQTLQALAYLHRRGIIHRDLKPGNVMVEGGRVKVLDFGVSMLRQHDVEDGHLIVGTLGYMAPELLGGTPASEASDLYAVGMIAYELFAGRYPFDITDLLTLKDDILRRQPDLGPIDGRVAGVIGWLLLKEPERRPENVDEVFEALGDWTGKPLVVETAATRDSFLQAAELVGRDDELAILCEMLDGAMAGQGAAALVGGESGVGKSRLLDELRARALVDGVVVLRGQAVSEGGGPYHVFREALRGLSLRADLDDLEASVLEAVVPEIGALLGREVPERPEIGPEAAQARLTRVVEDMFRRQQAPALLILEDLQWAGSESLKLLARIARLAGELRLFVVGSYRDDERSDMPSELPGMHALELGRLRAEDIAVLAASMLGEPGRRPEVIERLERETEGNPFFLVEVVRALAEEAGALSRVGVEPMPKTLSPGGMHRIVRRRLGRVPPPARALLEAAAVIGRQIDQALLRLASPDTDIDAWLMTCVNVAVIESHEGSFRFAHDKLREGLLADLSPDAGRDLHLRIAEAIEAVYPDEPEYTAALAHHYAAAGVAAKEACYRALAGEQALQSSAYREAAALYERAIELVERSISGAAAADPPTAAGGGLLARAVARAAPLLPIRLGRVDMHGDRFRLGHWEGRLAEVHGRLSNHAEAFRRGNRALGHLGLPMPSGKAGLVLGLPVQIAVRALESAWPAAFAAGSADARALLLEALRVQTTVTDTTFYTQEALPMLYSGLSMLNLGEPAGPSASLACGYALMAAVAGIIPLHPMAEAWSRRAIELVEAVGKPYDVAFVLQRVGSYRLWMARWSEAEGAFARDVEIARRVGDQRLFGDGMSCLILASIYQGRFVHAEEMFTEITPFMHRTEDPQLLCGGRILGAGIKLRRGKDAEALALSLDAQPLVDTTGASHDVLRGYAMLALGRLRAGEPALARAAAEKALGVIRATRPVAYWTYDGIAAVTEVLVSLWEADRRGPPEEIAPIAQRAREACEGARAFAKVFPIGEPCALLWAGTQARLSGEAAKAEKAWARAIARAEALGMPYERGRAYLERGRHRSPSDPRRREDLGRAADIFAGLGAEHDRARAESLR